MVLRFRVVAVRLIGVHQIRLGQLEVVQRPIGLLHHCVTGTRRTRKNPHHLGTHERRQLATREDHREVIVVGGNDPVRRVDGYGERRQRHADHHLLVAQRSDAAHVTAAVFRAARYVPELLSAQANQPMRLQSIHLRVGHRHHVLVDLLEGVGDAPAAHVREQWVFFHLVPSAKKLREQANNHDICYQSGNVSLPLVYRSRARLQCAPGIYPSRAPGRCRTQCKQPAKS